VSLSFWDSPTHDDWQSRLSMHSSVVWAIDSALNNELVSSSEKKWLCIFIAVLNYK
jgi:hypothetical protein